MKPLHLEVSGLHSYLEPVTVDFERLGRYGLFGIFGPIGAGKSTLLDAITLALYGRVDRVDGRGKKGIIHVEAQQVDVRLQFSVRDDDGRPEAYEVHRVYRETKASGAQSVNCRVVKLASGEVLADKGREVDECVEKLVGLNAEDFMRAVVLPQGRFMEVLHLKGAERRKMLQRMFHLHAYGEGLRRQLKRRHAIAREELASLQGELQGLGDASPARRREARAAHQQATEVVAAASTQAALAESQHREAEGRRKQLAQLGEARQALALLEAQRGEMEALSAQQQAAQRARPRVRPARAWLEARQALRQAESRAAASAEELARRGAAAEQATQRLQASTRQAQEREPLLRERVAALEEAQGLAREHERVQQQAVTVRGELQSAVAEVAKLSATLADSDASLAPLDKRLRKLRRELGKARVAPEEREQVEVAAEALRAVTEAKERRARAASAVDEAVAAVASASERLAAAQADAQGARATWKRAADEVAAARAAASDAQPERQQQLRGERQRCAEALARAEGPAQRLPGLVQGAERAQQQLLAATDAHRQAAAEVEKAAQRVAGAERALASAEAEALAELHRSVAGQLAQRLRPGEACQVCGSHDHPQPAPEAVVEGRAEAAVAAHRQGLSAALERQRQVAATAGRAAEALRTAEREHERAEQALTHARQELATALQPVAALVEPLADEERLPALASRIEALDTLLAEAEQAALVLERARAAHEEAAVAMERAEVPVAAATSEGQRAEARVDEAREQLDAAEAAHGAAWATWSEVSAGRFTVFDLPHARGELRQRDAEAARLDRALAQAEAERADCIRRRDDARARLAQCEAHQAKLQERSDNLAERLDALARELQRRTGGAPAAKELAAAREALEQLTKQVTLAQGEATKAAALHADARATHGAAAARCDAARSALATAREALGELADGPLPDDDEALSAVASRWAAAEVDEVQLAAWSERIDTWRAAHDRATARVELLAPAADAQPIDDDAWAALCDARQRTADALAAARDAAARADKHLADLLAKAERHAELVARIADVQRLQGHLDHLASVLRGDRFVDFVANDLLAELARSASAHLQRLTEGRYGLVVDTDAAFGIRDDDAGGAVRPVHTLSGGEAFLTSLALALALSTEVQARGPRPLEFFFLDEGFGTLDPEALDRVMTAIEGLRDGHRLIGLISHVPGVRERVPTHLMVHPAGKKGKGSSVELSVG